MLGQIVFTGRIRRHCKSGSLLSANQQTDGMIIFDAALKRLLDK
jgi:hypothetical protein